MAVILKKIIAGREIPLPDLLKLWERSVRASHFFLAEQDILRLRPIVQEALTGIPELLGIFVDASLIGFAGIQEDKLEMLFLAPEACGNGFGKEAVAVLVSQYGVKYVDVNEQNPAALHFYRRCGFIVYDRSETDPSGNPFPILHMTRKILETERLYLREMTPADSSSLAVMLQDIQVMYAWERTFSDDEVREWITRNRQRYQQYGYGYWLACEKTADHVLGQIGLLPETIEGVEMLGIGWILARNYWFCGYATEGAAECLHYAFQTLQAPEVIADIRPENKASIRVAERIGMTPTGQYDKIVYGKIMPHLLYRIRQ